ncbi:MAG TPA: Rieske (2Fe-2S) protein [Gemmatimonadaceae bacterium]
MSIKQNQNGDPSATACNACPVTRASRRAFLRDIGAVVATLFAAGAATSPAAALADAVTETRATGSYGPLRTYALPSTNSIAVDVGNEVILARWQNRVYAFSLKCPHRGARLEWIEEEERIFCPKHKARFLADGSHDSGRRSRDLDRYRVTRQGGSVAVDLSSILRADTDTDAWRAAVIDV